MTLAIPLKTFDARQKSIFRAFVAKNWDGEATSKQASTSAVGLTPEGWRLVTGSLRGPEALIVTMLHLVPPYSVQVCICFSHGSHLQLWLTDEMTPLKPADGCLAPGVIFTLLFLVSVPVSFPSWPLASLRLSPSVKNFDRKGNLTLGEGGSRGGGGS